MVTQSSSEFSAGSVVVPPARRPRSIDNTATVLVARSGTEQMLFLLPAGIFSLMRSVAPEDFAKVVTKQLDEDRLGPVRRRALLSLATIIGAFESTGRGWNYRLKRIRRDR